MKVKAICIDDTKKPKEIPSDKWIKAGELYNITHLYKQLNQNNIKGVELAEFDISMCNPYNCYRLSRFAINVNDLEKFVQMMKDTNELNNIDIEKFVKNLIEKEELILQD